MQSRNSRSTAALTCLAVLPALVSSAAVSEAGVPLPGAAVSFARDLEKSLNACDTSLFDSSIEWDALLDRGIADLRVAEPVKREFANGISRGFVLGDEICEAVRQSGSYVLLDVRDVDGELRALFRIVSDSGLNYHELLLTEADDGSVRILDMFIYSLGEWVSETARRGFLPLAVQLEKGALENMRRGENLYLDHVSDILGIQELYRQGEFAAALERFDSLPDEVKKNRNVLMIRFAVAVRLGGEAYDKAMLELKEAFPGDPSLDLVLIDHYFNSGKFDEALKILDRIDRSVGGDPYLDFMRANVLYADGRRSEARAAARRAVEREPGLEDPYWTLVTISLAERDFGETARLLDEIEDTLGVRVGDLAEIPEYSEFLESEAYDAWAASR